MGSSPGYDMLITTHDCSRYEEARMKRVLMRIGIVILCICTVFFSGCSDQTNQSLVKPGNPTSNLVEDMEYRPIELPLSTTVPTEFSLSNYSVGTLKDGNLLFRGMITNTDKGPVAGYMVVTIEVLGNDSSIVVTSPPLVSPRDLPAGEAFPYFYVTLTPVNEQVSSYRLLVQVMDRYPGV